MSNQCMQMTTSISCANRCTFCWRDYKAPVSTGWKWAVDDPTMIFEESVKAHHKLLVGFGGSSTKNNVVFEKSKELEGHGKIIRELPFGNFVIGEPFFPVH